MSLLAFAYMLCATICYTLVDMLVKWLGHFSAAQLGFYNSLFALLFIAVVMGYWRIRSRGHYGWLLLRGVSGMAVMVLAYLTTQRASLAVATTLKLLSGVLAPLVGIWMVGERVALPQWGFMLLSFAGVGYIHHFDTQLPPVALLTGLLAALCIAIALNVMKRLSGKEHPLIITLYMPLVSMPSLGAYLWWQAALWGALPQGSEWLVLGGMGLATVLGRYLHAKALQQGSVTDTSLMLYLMVVYSGLADRLLFAQQLSSSTLLGIAMILSGIVGNLLYKQWRSRAQG